MIKDLKDKKIGRLTALYKTRKNKHGSYLWMFRCDCGKLKEAIGSDFNRGQIKSCGCLKKEVGIRSTIHGYYGSPTYKSWQSMKERCYNVKSTSYHNYGMNGIKVCDRWIESFENFLEDMGERPVGTSLDRIDYNGDYIPSNCKWSTCIEQSRNRRTNKLNEDKVKEIKKLLINGKLFLREIAEKYNVSIRTIRDIKRNRIWRDI